MEHGIIVLFEIRIILFKRIPFSVNREIISDPKPAVDEPSSTNINFPDFLTDSKIGIIFIGFIDIQ